MTTLKSAKTPACPTTGRLIEKWQARVDATTYMLSLPENDKAKQLWEQLNAYVKTHIDAKTTFEIIKKVNAEFQQYFTNIQDYQADPVAFAQKFGNRGMPRPPKPKKLKHITESGLTLDGEKWAFVEKVHTHSKTGVKSVRRYLALTIEKQRWYIPFDYSNLPLPAGMTWRSLNISCYHGKVSLNFTYGHKTKSATDAQPVTDKSIKKPKVYAGIDLGLNILASLVVDDDKTPSALFCGMKLKHYNHNFNKTKAKLDAQLARCAVKFREVGVYKDGVLTDEIHNIPVTYNERGQQLLRQRKRMWVKREQVMETHFRQLSARIMAMLIGAGVTDLVLSKNLSFLKTADEKKNVGKRFNRRFYTLPLGRLITMLEHACKRAGINVQFIDEAYSSKTSSVSGNIIVIQQRASKARLSKVPHALTSADYGGSRSKRGRYKDNVHQFALHADVNGAVNHIHLARGEASLADERWLTRKHKLCRPKRLTFDFQAVTWIDSVYKKRVQPLLLDIASDVEQNSGLDSCRAA